jgi:Sulfocyanin (SoxE) domain
MPMTTIVTVLSAVLPSAASAYPSASRKWPASGEKHLADIPSTRFSTGKHGTPGRAKLQLPTSRRFPIAVSALALVAASGSGCGTSSQRSVPLSAWLSFHASAETVSVRLIAAYNDVYDGFNFNGYGKGQVLVEVPLGWRVNVRCVNNSSSMPHSCAIVRGVSGRTSAFPGAASPGPQYGLPPRHSAAFSFLAARAGTYRIVCLVPGHEQEGMWDVLDVTHDRLPAVVLLRRLP